MDGVECGEMDGVECGEMDGVELDREMDGVEWPKIRPSSRAFIRASCRLNV